MVGSDQRRLGVVVAGLKMGHIVRSHSPVGDRFPSIADHVRELRAACLSRADREGWGCHLGDTILGETVFMHFERGRDTYHLPVGSEGRRV